MVGLSLVLVALMPGVASAGTYTVPGCDASGRFDGWVASSSSAEYATAYGGGCPGYPNAGGLIARSVKRANTSTAPAGSQASWIFRAPAGTRIVGFSGFYRGTGRYPWVPGIRDPYSGRWINCSLACPVMFPNWTHLSYGGLSLRAIALTTVCWTGRCRRDGAHSGAAQLSHAVVVLADDTRPGVAITGGTLTAPTWRRGAQSLEYLARDNTGIRTIRVLADGRTVGRYDRSCDPWAVVPCHNAATTLKLDTAAVFRGEGRHVVTIEGTDGGYNRASSSRTVYIDNTAPAQPASLRVLDPGHWQTRNRFTVTWQSPNDHRAPIAGAVFRLCSLKRPHPCVQGRRWGSRLSAITNLMVPYDGRWMLRLWLRDRAGNEDRHRSVVVGPLRLDRAAPRVKMLPRTAADPTRLSVQVSDAVSGIKNVAIEVHRRGSRVWRDLHARRDGGRWSAVVNDEVLPAGRYDIRARAVDVAGNERSVATAADGHRARIKLPVRVRTSLRAGRRVGHHRRRHLDRKVVAHFGHSMLLRGRLMTPGRNPLGGSRVRVLTRRALPGAHFRHVGRVRTRRNGRFRYRVRRGMSRVVRFRYPGTRRIQGATRDVKVGVRASSTIGVKPRSTVNGGYVTFRGRLRGRPIPDGGKLVELQVYTRRRWRTFAQPRANAKSGRWRYEYRFEATRGVVTFRFRARIRHEAVYPYELGTSRRVKVRVRGL